MHFIVAAMVLAVAGCASGSVAQLQDRGSITELTADERERVYVGVKTVLKDPDSAKFGALTAVRADNALAICVQVNAKNSFGGYTGNQIMVGTLEGGNFRVVEHATLEGIRLLGICAKHEQR